jgi:hypothetical protein
MAIMTREEYSCDNCGKKLKTHGNKVEFVKSLTGEWDNPWERLHVRIIDMHGFHNDAEEKPADLCKECAIKILTDALKQVKSGIRMSAGIESSEALKFNQTF